MFVVVALTGFLLSTNVRVNRTATVTNDTADLVEQGVSEVNQLQNDVNDLQRQGTMCWVPATGMPAIKAARETAATTAL